MKTFMNAALLVSLVVLKPMYVCAQEADARAVAETVAVYCEAWSEPDFQKRTPMLGRTWAKSGTYTDPTAHVEGRDALNAHIGKFFEQYPGAKIVVSSGVDMHHARFRFAWKMIAADGSTALEGMDYGELDDQGRIRKIAGFFGPLPLQQ